MERRPAAIGLADNSVNERIFFLCDTREWVCLLQMRRRDAITLMTTVDRASLRSRAPRWCCYCCCCRCCCSTAHKRPSPTRLKIARKSVRGSMYSATIGTSGYWHPVIWMFSSFWEDVIPIAPFHYFLLDVFRLTHTHTHTHLFRSVKIKCSTRYEFMQMSAWCNWGKYRAAFKGVAKINCPLYTISQKRHTFISL